MKRLSNSFLIGLAVTIGAMTADAHADRTWACSVSQVQYDGYGRLLIICDGIGYWAQAGGNCPNSQPIETLRQWQALATSALLSGKTMDLYWDSSDQCGRRLSTVGILK